MSDDTKQMQEVRTKRTAKNSVFLDLFQDKKNLLKLYKTLHPEDTDVTENTLDIVTERLKGYSGYLMTNRQSEYEKVQRSIRAGKESRRPMQLWQEW